MSIVDANTAERVYAQLAEDFPPEHLPWVRAAHWIGPIRVPISRIDMRNRARWQATEDPPEVLEGHRQRILKKGSNAKPVVLVKEPGNPRLIIVDGHHRTLGYESLDQPVLAWVGKVGATRGPWDDLHASQYGGPSGEVIPSEASLKALSAACASWDLRGDARTFALDLGFADVHQPGGTHFQKGPPTAPPKGFAMSDLTTKGRKALPASKFALPKERKYPLNDAAHVRNAAARLEQEKKAGKISAGDYATAKRAIGRAAKRFGVDSKFNAGKKPMSKGVRVRASIAPGGHLHVSHMTAGKEFACRVFSPIGPDALGDDNGPKWIQLAKSGHFEGHKSGAFDLNAAVFGQIITNFRNLSHGEVPFDFEHASAMPPNTGSIPTQGAPAQGWIKDLKTDASGTKLFALVDWKEPARTYIKEGKYKHVSPVIQFGFKDPVSGQNIGARLASAALTNDPFLTGMTPIAASQAAAQWDAEPARELAASGDDTLAMSAGLAHAPSEYMPRIRRALCMSELASAKECSDELGRLRDLHDGDADGDDDGMHEGVALDRYRMPLRELVAAAPGSTWDEVFDVVQDLIDAAIGEHVLEDHGGEQSAAMDQDLSDSGGEADLSLTNNAGADAATLTNGDTTMPTKEELDAAQKAAKDAADRAAAAEAKNAELQLQLTAAQAANEKTAADVAALKKSQEERDARELDVKVDCAIRDYADKGLTVAMKAELVTVAKNSPTFFDKMYPPKVPATAHLSMNLTGAGGAAEVGPGKAAPSVALEGGQDPQRVVAMSLADVAQSIADAKNIPYEDAMYLAARLAKPVAA